jgi:long-chain fatty acid transport protein
MKRYFIMTLGTLGLIGVTELAMASAFQLWEQSGASVGNYHAGYAASVEDASTAFFNPAGITRFKNQQLVLGAVGILSDFKYRGTVNVNTLLGGTRSVTAQGGTFSFVPDLHYVAPLTDRLGFGLSVDAPFGLKTNYGRKTALRYASTLASITVIDASPSLGVKITDQASLGAGVDAQRVLGEFDLVGGLLTPALDTDSTNKANGTAYGYHLGGLYEFNINTRVGLSYHSQVVHHLTGNSRFTGPIARLFNRGMSTITSNHAKVNITLPPYTALSAYHRLRPQVALMGSIIYTQWNVFKELNLQHIAGIIAGPASSNDILISIPQHYNNSWNLSLGADYFATDAITLRGAIGYDQTPVRNRYRNVQLPDNDRYVIALGGHLQATKTVGVDVGWTHLFINKPHVAPPPQVNGIEVVSTRGSVTGGADVFGAQFTWDMV